MLHRYARRINWNAERPALANAERPRLFETTTISTFVFVSNAASAALTLSHRQFAPIASNQEPLIPFTAFRYAAALLAGYG